MSSVAPESPQLPQPVPPRQLTSTERATMAIVGVTLSCLLVIAWVLTPSPTGLGTHQQLGLPGCSMLTFTGIRCPGCGMTTSWAHVMRGNIAQACSANLGGTVLCLLTIFVTPVFLYMSVRGMSTPYGWFSKTAIPLLILAMAVSIVEWLIRLAVA